MMLKDAQRLQRWLSLTVLRKEGSRECARQGMMVLAQRTAQADVGEISFWNDSVQGSADLFPCETGEKYFKKQAFKDSGNGPTV